MGIQCEFGSCGKAYEAASPSEKAGCYGIMSSDELGKVTDRTGITPTERSKVTGLERFQRPSAYTDAFEALALDGTGLMKPSQLMPAANFLLAEVSREFLPENLTHIAMASERLANEANSGADLPGVITVSVPKEETRLRSGSARLHPRTTGIGPHERRCRGRQRRYCGRCDLDHGHSPDDIQ